MVLIANVVYPQAEAAPKKEFSIELSEYAVDIKPGSSKDVTIYLHKSKSYARANASLGLSSGLPEGITVTFEPEENVGESSIAHINVGESVKTGICLIVLNGTILNKNKGVTLKVRIGESSSDVTKID
jgi:hypothetical protein